MLQKDFHEIHILGKPSALYFNSAPTMKDLLEKLTFFLKRQPTLPEWLRNGIIIGMQGGTEKVHQLCFFSQFYLLKMF